VQFHNWLLRYPISQEGIPLHVGPGNIFRRKAGTKMTEEIQQEEIVRIYDRDEDGNPIINK
jgi:hypothetical protein